MLKRWIHGTRPTQSSLALRRRSGAGGRLAASRSSSDGLARRLRAGQLAVLVRIGSSMAW